MNPKQRRRANAEDRLYAAAGFTLSAHARQRQREWRVGLDEVLRCACRPEQTYPSPAHKYGPNRITCQRGRIAVILDTRTREVVTIVPRTQQHYQHGVHGLADLTSIT